MRISDWGSDGCSSDLRKAELGDSGMIAELGLALLWIAAALACLSLIAGIVVLRDGPKDLAGLVSSEERRQGKSVSVRVDLGGRRTITRKGGYTHAQSRRVMISDPAHRKTI